MQYKSTQNTIVPADSAHFLSERFALIYACLTTGDVKRAEILFQRTTRIFVNSFGSLKNGGFILERGMVNAFVEAYLSQSKPDRDKALEWHTRAQQDFSLPADGTTYAALIHHTLISCNNLASAAKLVLEMKNVGKLNPRSLLSDRRFVEPEDQATLQALLRGMDASFLVGNEDDAVISQMLLDAAKANTSAAPTPAAAKGPKSLDSLMLSALKDNAEAAAAAAVDADAASTQATGSALATPVLSDLKETNSMGVKILRKTLASLRLTSTETTIVDKLRLQEELEEKALSAAVEELTESQAALPESMRSVMHLPGRFTVQWNRALVQAIREEIEALEEATQDADQHGHVPFLKLLTAEQLAKITITEFLRVEMTGGGGGLGAGEEVVEVDGGAVQAVPTVRILSRIGSQIETEHNLQQLKKKKNRKMIETQAGIHNMHINGRLFNNTIRKIIAKLAMEEADKHAKDNWIPKWPTTTKVRAASVLAILFMKIAKIKVPQADPGNPLRDIKVDEMAFVHGYAGVKGKQMGVIKMHPHILETLSTDPVHVHPRLLPMVVPPRPWLTRNSGGYINYKSDVLRTSSKEHLAYLAAADERQLLSGVFESLDVLGKTAWQVNPRVYEVVKQVWNSGKAVAEFPALEEEGKGTGRLQKAKKPENWEAMEGAAKRAWVLERQKEDAERRNNFSQRCDMNYKIEIARTFIGQTIYFPHNVDFRGRAYPMPAHLNHMGNDFCRGLLMFDQKKRLGERGLKWLKIQVANLMGNNKISFDDRAKYAEDHIDDIMDSADNPLDGKRWWLTAEDPWQMLATCFELTDALRSPDPVEFKSCVPVHQDGTCNGLQHYAALGGDKLGATQVNLVPSEKPGDIYTAVADRVDIAVNKLAAEGCEESKLMMGKITRKLVKQTVMTNTYGVTFVGARAQVKARIKESPELYPFTDDQINKCSLKITHLIFDSLGELFTGARAIQNWLNSTAFMIAKSIPATAIPQIQLDDAACLSRIGCLPSAFTVARAEARQVASLERVVDEKVEKKVENAATVDDIYRDLLDAVLDDEAGQGAAEADDFFDMSEDPAEVGKEAQAAVAAVDSASAIASAAKKVDKMASVIWTTPLGLPIVQPYRAIKTRQITTMLQTILIRDHSTITPVNPMKQSTAFPPNFIHSLDATHMMLSAIACNKSGIDFAAVHDSYWTHACDVDTMATVLRDTFVTLHGKNLMQNLRGELQERNASNKYPVILEISDPNKLKLWAEHLKATGRVVMGNRILKEMRPRKVQTWVDLAIPPLPARGDFDLELVKKSPYFFH
ncbi:hypothetical protein BC830DRAFT_1071858 [Chytriomyces sp. MP71]|nr:hypothetical protein BC830DRAFT_1071858 [Chytriomyces sp. MP71]